MKTNIFKLGEYKIIESDDRYLKWETHSGIGEIKEGRCFQKGSILFIGPPESRRDGFLKFEFMAHLKGFPDWGLAFQLFTVLSIATTEEFRWRAKQEKERHSKYYSRPLKSRSRKNQKSWRNSPLDRKEFCLLTMKTQW